MIIKQYTGWWDDIPSQWSLAPLELHAMNIAELAGGVDKVIDYARTLLNEDLLLASQFYRLGLLC